MSRMTSCGASAAKLGGTHAQFVDQYRNACRERKRREPGVMTGVFEQSIHVL